MKCIKKDLIQKYIDNEATPVEVSYIEKHLESCPHCVAEVNCRKKLSGKVILSMNQLVDENIPIPVFIHAGVSQNKRLVIRKRIIYSLSAACALLLVLFILDKTKSNDDLQVTVVNTIEVDANRTAADQEMVFKVIDPEGNITEFNID